MTKLFFSKVLQSTPHVFLKNKNFRTKNVSILVSDTWLYFLALHLKFSSASYPSQLVEIFAYDTPVSANNSSDVARVSNATLVYQFHNLFSQERVFVFASSLKQSYSAAPKSLTELFACAAWLEREVGEMHGLCFEGKKDLRNLMLQYGDSSAPFRKSYPSIGLKEVVFDSVTDTLIQVPVSTQI